MTAFVRRKASRSIEAEKKKLRKEIVWHRKGKKHILPAACEFCKERLNKLEGIELAEKIISKEHEHDDLKIGILRGTSAIISKKLARQELIVEIEKCMETNNSKWVFLHMEKKDWQSLKKRWGVKDV